MSDTQGRKIRDAIVGCITNDGMTDKREIYSRVAAELGVPRPTIRRVASALRVELAAEIAELEERLRVLGQVKPRAYWQ